MCDTNILARFTYLPEESLRALHKSLALGMHLSQLYSCSAYYRSIHRDPSVDELRLIDACITAYNVQNTGSMTLSSLVSSDETIAAMLRSLIAQNKTVNGMTPPLTLASCLDASRRANPSVPMANTKTGAQFCFVSDEAYGSLPMRGLTPERSVCIGETGLRLTLALPNTPHGQHSPIAGEPVALISLPDQRNEGYFARLHSFLSRSSRHPHIRGLSDCARGALPALLHTLFPNGCYADMSVFSPEFGGASSLERAAQARGYLIWANETDMNDLLEHARACGLDMKVFARLTNDGMLTLAERDTPLGCVPITLLRSLTRRHAVSLQLNPQSSQPVSAQSRPAILTAANSWERQELYSAGEPMTLGDDTVMHTSLPLYDTLSVHDVMRAIMQCALHLTAAGGDFHTMCAAVALSIGTQSSPCSLWSAVLGTHRMLSDWHIPSLPSIIKSSEAPSGSVTICLFARTITPSKTVAPAPLRLFAVKTDNKQMPDPQELRAMLSLTSRALADGQIAGLRPLWNRPLNDALMTVKDLTLDHTLCHSGEWMEQGVFGLFVRADATVTHGILLGSFAPAEQQATTEPNDEALIPTPARYSLVHRERPIVLLPLLPTVDCPHSLIAYLRSLGATVQLLSLSLTHECCTELANALANADILLLNGDTPSWSAILAHRRVRYALDRHLSDRDGTLIAVRGASAAVAQTDTITATYTDEKRLLLCPDGLTRDMLASAVAYYR